MNHHLYKVILDPHTHDLFYYHFSILMLGEIQ